MPDILRLHGSGPCPSCGHLIVEAVRCQWGLLPGGDYQLGEPVRWLTDADGSSVPPFRLRKDPALGYRWNCGDPQFRMVMAFDLGIWGDYPVRCPRCDATIVGSAAIVRDGVFREILVLTEAEQRRILGASVGKADLVIVREDGSFWPREDWEDHTLHFDG